MWTPDVYEGAPTPVVAFFAAAPKLAAMVLYMIDVTGFFACLAALSRDGRPMETMDDMAGLIKERPGLALAMTAFSLSALGLPPFSGFWAKVYVFKAALGAGTWSLTALAVLGLVSSVVAAFYYLRLIKVMWFDPSAGATDATPAYAKGVAYVAALFSFPVVMIALTALDPLTANAAVFGLG